MGPAGEAGEAGGGGRDGGPEPGGATFVTPARRRFADAARHLVDAVLTSEHATEPELDRAARHTEQVAAAVSGREVEGRPSGVRTRHEAGHDDYFVRSPLFGAVQPIAPPFTVDVGGGGRMRAHGVFGAACEGPPGYVHGGWVALAFDEVLGVANVASGHAGMTGRLTVRYRRPTPLHVDVRFDAWTERVDGRRIVTRGTLHAGGVLTAEAEGLFVRIDDERRLEYFGERRVAPEPPDPLP